MVFDNKIEPSCTYCRFARELGNDELACLKRGIVDSSGFCGSFRYEPTKREPLVPPKLDVSGLSEDEFSLLG